MIVMQMVGCILGALAAIIVLCLACTWLEKHYPSENYDERQKLVRGRASSVAMGAGFVYFIIVLPILISQIDKEKTIEPHLLVLWGALFPVIVNHTYCLINHAALPLSQKPLYSIVVYTLLGVLYIWNFGNGLERFELSFVGKGSMPWVHLTAGICFLYLSLMHTVQFFRDRKERA